MIYNSFKDKKLSALGYGAMRFPITNGVLADISESAAEELVDYAIRNGINYFDTAWGYHDGNSEVFLGKALSKYPRESWYLANKFPGYDLSNMDKVEEIFEKQLEKCGVDYFDFYLFHNVCELNINDYLDESHGIYDYLINQKKNGRIRHLGFSTHGSLEVIERFLSAYGKDMEFCQLQVNWLDWTFQNAKAKVELMREHNIPVWVMEPLRGGKLAKMDEKYTETLKTVRPEESGVAWAFRFLQSIPNVTVTLSGMSTMEQLRDNLTTFESNKPLSDAEWDTLMGIAENMKKGIALPCTACRYCTSHCPQELDIPHLIDLYNEHVYTEGGFYAPMTLRAMPKEKHPHACIGCKSCEAVCPQQIKIADAMTDFVKRLEGKI
ncbi:MAG: oxidoreductase [Ruminococcaceae bacterium]|nr:oxidoreductase [Oscillospiraceae bacterium]